MEEIKKLRCIHLADKRDNEKLCKAIEEVKFLNKVIDMMAEEITDFTGSCPADIFDKEWDEEEGDCEHCKSTDKECFIKYYFKKARGEENETKEMP